MRYLSAFSALEYTRVHRLRMGVSNLIYGVPHTFRCQVVTCAAAELLPPLPRQRIGQITPPATTLGKDTR